MVSTKLRPGQPDISRSKKNSRDMWNLGLTAEHQRTLFRASVCFLVFLATLAITPVVSPATTNRTPEQLYQDAVTEMEAMPQPSFLTASIHIHDKGMGFQVRNVYGWASPVILSIGGVRSAEWNTFYRLDDNCAEIVTAKRAPLLTHDAMFIPTWLGAFSVLMYGFPGDPPGFFGNLWKEHHLNPALVSAVSSCVAPAPTHNAEAVVPVVNGVKLATIAVVRAIAPPAYRVIDAGPARCGTSVGRHLRLLAYDPRTHPLTDVVVDLANNRFCMMRFNIGDPAFASLRGSYEIHFAKKGRYLVVRRSLVTLHLRVLGLSLQKTTLAFSYRDFTFPKSIPASAFFP